MEVSALEQGDSHGAKIVAANLCPNERRPIRFGLGGMSLHLAECMIPVLLAKKDVADSTCRLHSRDLPQPFEDRKSTRLNSSHQIISYAVFCLKKKKSINTSTLPTL